MMNLMGKIFLLIGGAILLIWGIFVFFDSVDMPAPLKWAVLFLGLGLILIIVSLTSHNNRKKQDVKSNQFTEAQRVNQDKP